MFLLVAFPAIQHVYDSEREWDIYKSAENNDH